MAKAGKKARTTIDELIKRSFVFLVFATIRKVRKYVGRNNKAMSLRMKRSVETVICVGLKLNTDLNNIRCTTLKSEL